MYIHSVKMLNFKSIGKEDNEIILEPRVTTIIGKNESGKSNVLEGLSYISFVNNMNTAFSNDNINRNNGTDSIIEYSIILKPNTQERELKNIKNDTQILISKDSYSAKGGILEYYNNNIRQQINILVETLGQNPFQSKDQDYTNYNSYISDLQQEDSINIRRINDAFTFFEARIPRIKVEDKEKTSDAISNVKSKWNSIVSMLPNTFYRNTEKILKTQYTIDEVKQELSNPSAHLNSLLPEFIKLIDILKDDFIMAVQAGTSGVKTTIRKRINRKVEMIINEEFQKFYSTEPISLSVDFDTNIVSFSVYSGEGEALLLSERSNGLRWYLNTFIDAKANGISQSNVIYLFDEPGISLHVNAQKELLNLFDDLANKGNQIVYTTHSPYMLNMEEDGIHRIRAIEKDDPGYTHIYKTAYDSRLAPQNQQDTLAPIISAIGMTLQDTFGPAKDKLNIVTEGVSDYIYLKAMSKVVEIDMDRINIIPSCGVTNSINLCNILSGWNCPFIAIFDFDKEGVECGGEKMSESLLYEIGKQYIYLKDIDQELILSKEYNKHPYMIEDLVGRDILNEFIKQKGLSKDLDKRSKTLLSKLFCNAIEDKTYSVNDECKSRFKDLFDRILDTYKI